MAVENQDMSEGESARGRRRLKQGVVTSDKCHKTIGVECAFTVKHAKYGKYFGRRTRIRAHDEENAAKLGDRVEVMECRPISKTKHWRLVRILKRN